MESGASIEEAGRELRQIVCGVGGKPKPMSATQSRAEGCRESAHSAGMEPQSRCNRFLHPKAVTNQHEGSPDNPDAAMHNSGIPASTLFPLQNHSSYVHNQAIDLNSRNPSSKFLLLQGHSANVYLDRGSYPISACPIRSKIDAKTYKEFRDRVYSFKDKYFNTIFDVCMMHIDISQVVRHRSFEECLGVPLQQTVRSTCALVSSTVCMEAHHRLKYEMVHGAGTFPCIAAAPRKLRNLCYRRGVWDRRSGARVADVLDEIMDLGGVRTTNAPPPAPCFLPLRSWQMHIWEDGLTAYDVADLIDSHGPLIGDIWVCPWYDLFNSDEDDHLVYWSGCARSKEMKNRSLQVFGRKIVSFHSVVCFAYRFCSGQMHVHILDNGAPNGPRRWIHYEELVNLYTIDVERMDHLGEIRYPHSGYHG